MFSNFIAKTPHMKPQNVPILQTKLPKTPRQGSSNFDISHAKRLRFDQI